MFTPEGLPAENTDRVMLLSMWFNTLAKESGVDERTPMNKRFIAAGMGRPTFRINPFMVDCFIKYWQHIADLLKEAQSQTSKLVESLALGYCDPRGDPAALQVMSGAMSKWYDVKISKENILFTVGGAGALRIIFETFNVLFEDIPNYRVITPFPHYTLYKDNRHQLHPIHVMEETGYQLTAAALEASIVNAYELAAIDGDYPKVFLFSNPNNPLGTVISEKELYQIADVLRKYSDLTIVIDEAYAEMIWAQKVPSLLKIAPDLQKRIIILRSATKALSAAGERMALLMAFDPVLMAKLLAKNIGNVGHAPQSSQLAYAYTMKHFDSTEQSTLVNYYKPKVEYVLARIKAMGAAMPDIHYEITSTFYVLCDFSDLLGMEIAPGAERALGRTGTVLTNEELCYSLLFKERIMLAPGMYSGMGAENGYMRITCSGQKHELKEMLNRLEGCLFEARAAKSVQLIIKIKELFKALGLNSQDPDKKEFARIIKSKSASCIQYKRKNAELIKVLQRLESRFNNSKPSTIKTVVSILSFLSPSRALVNEAAAKQAEWKKFINDTIKDPSIRAVFLNFGPRQREEYQPWVNYQNSKLEQKSASNESTM